MRLIDLGRKIAELKMEPKSQEQTRLGPKPCGPGPKTILDGNRRDSNSTVSCYGTMSHVSSRRNSQASQVVDHLREESTICNTPHHHHNVTSYAFCRRLELIVVLWHHFTIRSHQEVLDDLLKCLSQDGVNRLSELILMLKF